MLSKAQLQNLARPEVVFRILVGPDPENLDNKAAMVIKNGELWFSISGSRKDWSKKKTAAAVKLCCERIVEDYCKKELI